jgi:5'-methylthioadenosine phosphorylase
MSVAPLPDTGPSAEIGVIGGSGFYDFFTTVGGDTVGGDAGAREVTVETPWGPPSDPLVLGEVAGRQVAFLPRHGRDHRFPAHRVNYRANLWALRSVGVRQVLGPCAVGSMRVELGPGSVVVPDQVVDRTWGREHTYYGGVGPVAHVAFADPYCSHGRTAVATAAGAQDLEVTDGGTLVVVNGPRFSSRAESRWHAAQGWSVVGMTGMPEAALARELALCYTSIALVTDLDAGVEAGGGVTHQQVLRVVADNAARLRTLLAEVVPALPGTAVDCACRHALDGVRLPFDLP